MVILDANGREAVIVLITTNNLVLLTKSPGNTIDCNVFREVYI